MDEQEQYQQQQQEQEMDHDELNETQEQEQQQGYLNLQQSPTLEDTEEETSTPITSTTTSFDTDKPMAEAEPPTPVWSVIDDVEQIINKELAPLEEEILETKVDHWDIKNWNELAERQEGPIIQAGGHEWNILMFPKGNNQSELVSIYLDLTNAKTTKDPEEYACAQFIVCLSKPSDPTKYISHNAYHRFTSDESDWGFTRFIPIEEKNNLAFPQQAEDKPTCIKQLLEDDGSVRLTTIIRVVKDATGILWHNFVRYDSKKVTGCVGLSNQGATCYMNSLFQSLYFTNSFRRAVYQIPTEDDVPTKSVALALQRVFYNLQFVNTAVETTELTKSFGWDSLEAFRQHDVQEFNRVLQDNLELKMKNTPADGAIKNLFVGRMKSYIKCINVNFESSRSEDFYDIQLNVKGCKNLEDSFKDYITEETLEGDNKYMAEGYGLQDAKKGVIFESFPPVLHLQLKRFEYDMMRDMMVKINDRHEFPTEIDLEPFLSENADKSKGHKYVLHGVLVHSGDLSGGHYFAFVKPEKDGKWLKFDDDRVTPATLKEVLEENFGGEQQNLAGINIRPNGRPMNRFTNAYMLVYIRESELDHVLAPVTEIDIPRHLSERIENEARLREQRRKEKEEQHLYMKTLIASEETFRNNFGFDFINFSEENKYLITDRIRKDQLYGEFKKSLAEHIGLETSDFRLWLMVNRQNKTVRIDIPIPTEEEEGATLDDVRQKYATSQSILRFYLEKGHTVNEQGLTIFPAPGDEENILIFIKHFRPEHQSVHGLCQLYVRKDSKVNSIVNHLKTMIGLDEAEEILLFEEIKANMIDPVDFTVTFAQAELQDGDILCVQKKLTPEEEDIVIERRGFTKVDDFMNHELGKVDVHFAPLSPDQETTDLKLTLHKEMGYEEIASHVAMALNVDPKKLRLINPYLQGTTRSATTANPKRFAGMKLGRIVQNANPTTNFSTNPTALQQAKVKLYYEKLEVSLEEIEKNCSVSVTVCTPTLKDTHVVNLLLPKDSGYDYLIKALGEKGVQFHNEKGTGIIRIFEEMDGKFHREYTDKSWRDAVATRPSFKVYAEEIPVEDCETNNGHIGVFHYQRTPTRTHSVPFKFAYRENEPLSETKKRLQARTGLDDKEWSKVKLTIVADDEVTTTPVNDDDETLFSSATYKDGDMIGLDHVDKTTKIDKVGAIFIRG